MSHEFFSYTDKGPRSENQDAIRIHEFSDSLVACLADGVGGAKCGSMASTNSISFFFEAIQSSEHFDLKAALLATHLELQNLQLAHPECVGMATTFTGCMIRNKSLFGIHAGDSRLCILRGNGIKQLTVAH